MQAPQSTLLLAVAVLAAGGYALMFDASPSEAQHVVSPDPEAPLEQRADIGEMHPAEDDPSVDPGNTHDLAPDDEAVAIEWTVPAGWRSAPSPSSMRIATYAVPRSPRDAVDAEVSVTRAGGDVSSNIDRWAAQFEGAVEPKRRSHPVHGLDITVVEIEGTFTNAMDKSAGSHPGWALLAAIVKTPGQPYFFKMTGPAATVRAARGAFTTLIDSIHPTG